MSSRSSQAHDVGGRTGRTVSDERDRYRTRALPEFEKELRRKGGLQLFRTIAEPFRLRIVGEEGYGGSNPSIHVERTGISKVCQCLGQPGGGPHEGRRHEDGQ